MVKPNVRDAVLSFLAVLAVFINCLSKIETDDIGLYYPVFS